MKKIIFRADAGVTIGYGHFIRTLALADMLKDDFQCVFVTQSPTEYQKAEVAKVCELVELPATNEKFRIFLNMLRGDEIVVLDNYFYDTDYQWQIKDKGCKLVCIDDIHDKHYVADIVINHAVNEVSLFSVEPYTKLCIGPEYLLMRSPFRESCRKYNIPQIVADKSVFVCFGGADEFGLTQKVAEILIHHTDFHVHAVLGSTEKIRNSFTELKKSDRLSCYNRLSSEEMVELIKKSQIAIVPASTVFFEVCCLRKPVISGYYVDNQVEIARLIQHQSLGWNCGNFFEQLEQKILDKMALMNDFSMTSMIQAQINLIKDSTKNITSQFLNL